MARGMANSSRIVWQAAGMSLVLSTHFDQAVSSVGEVRINEEVLLGIARVVLKKKRRGSLVDGSTLSLTLSPRLGQGPIRNERRTREMTAVWILGAVAMNNHHSLTFLISDRTRHCISPGAVPISAVWVADTKYTY